MGIGRSGFPAVLSTVIIAVTWFLLGIADCKGQTASTTFYVAPTGSDLNTGSITNPYATIQRCAGSATAGSTCVIRAGTYAETVTPNSGITITAYPGETVTIDGTNPVTGWSLYQGNIYKTAVTMGSGDTNQIFVGQTMMTEAKWPNGGDLFHPVWSTLAAGTNGTTLVDPNLPNANWVGAHIHFWSGSDPWDPQTAVVTASSNGQLSFTLDDPSYPPYIQPQSGGYYYLFGTLAALDSPGEWAYDSVAGILYFWAPGNANPASLDVRVKTRQFGFELSGKSGVTISNLSLFGTAINSSATSSKNVISGITATYVSHFTTLPNTGSYATSYWYDHTTDSGIVLAGAGNVLQNSVISYSAGNGVSLVGFSNIVTNNLIHHVNYMANNTGGIVVTGANNKIQNNTLYASGRHLIYLQSLPTPNFNDISYNDLFNAMMFSRDDGEIYVGSLPEVSGTTIHHNWLHDTWSLYSGPADTYSLPGVYLDENASGFSVYQNVLWNNENNNIFMHGSSQGGKDPDNNAVYNNSIPDINPTGYIWLQTVVNCGTTRVVNNLVLVPITETGSSCALINNGAGAPGATQMTANVVPGCNFTGCNLSKPPTISGSSVSASIVYQPYDLTISSGQAATFSVVAAGSPPLSYQWLRNGSAIAGATSASYSLPTVSSTDSGSAFSVIVSNSLGSLTSQSAHLTVQ